MDRSITGILQIYFKRYTVFADQIDNAKYKIKVFVCVNEVSYTP